MLITKNRAGNAPARLFFVAAAVALLGGCTPPGPRALVQGKKLIEQGNYVEALGRLKEAASLLNTNAQAWNYLGLAYHHVGQIANAVQSYQKALTLDYDLAEVHYNLGCLWLEQNRLDSARIELTSYTSLRKNSETGWLKLGVVQLRSVRAELHGFKPAAPSGHPPELAAAEKSLNEALRLDPRNPEILNDLGIVELCRNRARESAERFRAALELQPGYAPALLNLAVVLQVYLNDPRSALQKYREFLALPDRPPEAQACDLAARELEVELSSPPPTARTNGLEKPSPNLKTIKPGMDAANRPVTSASGTPTNSPTPPPKPADKKNRVKH